MSRLTGYQCVVCYMCQQCETFSSPQMDPEEMDFVSKLLAIGQGWGQNFFVSCLLFLSPEDLKACRLVNKTWAELIKEGVWGNKRARKTL